jgi:hypothetical protein
MAKRLSRDAITSVWGGVENVSVFISLLIE